MGIICIVPFLVIFILSPLISIFRYFMFKIFKSNGRKLIKLTKLSYTKLIYITLFGLNDEIAFLKEYNPV
jgi:hypothetical protein